MLGMRTTHLVGTTKERLSLISHNSLLRPLQGMVTRKDLLGYKLDEAVARARGGSVHPRATLD